MSHPHRRRLGQHFLADPHYRRRIADAADLRPDDLVIEIGAGRGAMTGLLAERTRHVVAVELDSGLVAHLREKFAADERIELLPSDILEADIAVICRRHATDQCFVFGNVPYYITSPILEHLGKFRSSIRAMVLLVQREVGERMAAPPGSRDYGYLSVFVQMFSKPRLMFRVPPGAFAPAPKVQSALVTAKVEPRFPEWSQEKEEGFLNFVKTCFARKRKNILNNLASFGKRSEIEHELGRLLLPPSVRAEQMSIEQLAQLYERLKERR